jgi:hypothetical protein
MAANAISNEKSNIIDVRSTKDVSASKNRCLTSDYNITHCVNTMVGSRCNVLLDSIVDVRSALSLGTRYGVDCLLIFFVSLIARIPQLAIRDVFVIIFFTFFLHNCRISEYTRDVSFLFLLL